MRFLLFALSLLLVACAGDDTTPSGTQPTVVPMGELPPLGDPPEGVEDLVLAANAYGKEHPDAFAGVFVAQQRVWVGFTEDAAGHLAALRKRVSRPDVLAAFEARHSDADLRALQARITDDFDELHRLGVDVAGVGMEVRSNRVKVSLRSTGGRGPDIVRERYGADKVVVVEGVEFRPAR